MKRSVLVTGGAGFIGSHLGRRLLAEGFRVVCMDNLYTGSRRNIEELEREKLHLQAELMKARGRETRD